MPDPEDPFNFEGPEIFKCVGCTIDWLPGKNLTIKHTLLRVTELHERIWQVTCCQLDMKKEGFLIAGGISTELLLNLAVNGHCTLVGIYVRG